MDHYLAPKDVFVRTHLMGHLHVIHANFTPKAKSEYRTLNKDQHWVEMG